MQTKNMNGTRVKKTLKNIGLIIAHVVCGCQTLPSPASGTPTDADSGMQSLELKEIQPAQSEKNSNQNIQLNSDIKTESRQEARTTSLDKTLARKVPNSTQPALELEVDEPETHVGEEESAAVEELPNDTELEELDADSSKSPAELAQLIPESETLSGIEGSFALCEGSIYMQEWQNNFDARWLAENGSKFKKPALQNRALNEARSQEFLRLLFPALGKLNFDYPVVITDDVIKWMQYFQTRGRKAFVTWLRRAEDVLPQIRPVLEKYGLPQDLVYLAMIESGFNNRALSFAQAAGTWQFMRATGRMYGLKINDYVDERRNPSKSTEAAAVYLTNLYTRFGDWHLAAASYNAGEGRIMKALRGAEQTDFTSLAEAGRLPNETRNYVPKLIAAMIISKNPGKFGFDVAGGSRVMRTRKIKVQQSIAIADLSKSLKIDPSVLESLNPELRLGITPPSVNKLTAYELQVPERYADQAVAMLDDLPTPELSRRVAAKARRRESLYQFATRYGVTVSTLLKANPRVRANSRLRVGQSLIVPISLGTGQYERLTASGKSKKHRFHAAQRGGRRGSRVATRKAAHRIRSLR